MWELTEIELEEISCVDIGANQHADIVLFKRAVYDAGAEARSEGVHAGNADVTTEKLTTEVETLIERVEELTTEVETLIEHVETLTERDAVQAEAVEEIADAVEAQSEALEEAAEALEEAAEELEEAAEELEEAADATEKSDSRAKSRYINIDGKRIAKSSIPPVVLARLEKQAAEIAKVKRELHEAALAKRGAEELPNLAGTPLAKGRLLEAVGGDKQLLRALKAADAAMARVYAEKGRADQHEMLTPEQELDKLAKAHADANGTSYELAYAAVLKTEHGRSLLTRLRGHSN